MALGQIDASVVGELFGSLPLFLLVLEPTDGFPVRYATPNAARYLEVAPEDLEAFLRDWSHHMDPQDRENRVRGLSVALIGGRFAHDYQLRLRTGRHLDLSETVHLERDDDGNPERLICAVQVVTGQRSAEKALWESEARFTSVFERSIVPSALHDSSGRITAVNQAFGDWLGHRASDMVGGATEDIIHIDDIDRNTRRRQQLWSGEISSARLEQRYIHRDGSVLWGLVSVTPVHDATGQVYCLLAQIQDITERKRAEAAVKAREGLFRAIFRDSMLPTAVVERDGSYSLANRAFCELLGYAEDEMTGMNFLDVTLPEDRAGSSDRLEAFLKGGADAYQVQKRYRRKNGQIIWALVSTALMRDEDGNPVYTLRQVQDVTDQVRSEVAQRETENRLQAVVEYAAAAIAIRDLEGRYLLANREYHVRHAREEPTIVGLMLEDILPAPDAEKIRQIDRHIVESGRGATRESSDVYPDGVERHVHVSSFPVRGEDGSIFAVGVISTDITEFRQVESQLHHAQKMEAVGQLTGGIAHDFNNLLNVILGNLELIAADAGNDSVMNRRLDRADRAVQRGAELTDRLLSFSRKQALRPVAVNANALVSDMSNLLKRTLAETIQVETILDRRLKKTLADPGQLENAILNLALNARDALTRGGRLIIETGNRRLDAAFAAARQEVMPGDYVMIAVSDTGQGMPPTVRERVFEPFFTTKDVGAGSGLGLSMVYGFIKQSGGHVDIDSQPEQGTTVTLYLPVAKARKLPETHGGPERRAPSGKREVILLVEDDEELRRLGDELLESLNYRVLSAQNGPEALVILDKTSRVDLLFTDFVLPRGLNGSELAAEARRRRPGLKVLFTSGYAHSANGHKEAPNSNVDMIAKPYKRADVADRIREMLERPNS